jgi:hypothetical protein
LGRRPTLGEFLEQLEIEPDDLYRRDVSFARLCSAAGLSEPFSDPEEAQLTKGLRRIAHTADAEQIARLMLWLGPARRPRPLAPLDTLDDRRLLMMDLSLWGRAKLPASSDESIRRLDANPTLRDELRELLAHRRRGIDSVAPRLTLPFACPLTLHAPYTRDEVLAALGHWTRDKQKDLREGVLHLPDLKADVFFFTLNKTEAHYSPTTMYQDYAVNEWLFHWQSQSTTSAESETGQRYIEHVARGYTVLLFGRENQKHNNLAQPYAFLGPARYVGHSGSRPMSITWKLEHPLAARLFRTLARLSVA